MSDITIPGGKIRSFVERIENLDTELQELNEQKKEVFSEAKGEGFDVKILKEIIKLRKQDQDERDEREVTARSLHARHGHRPGRQSREGGVRPCKNSGTASHGILPCDARKPVPSNHGIGARVQVFQSVQGRRVHDVCTGRNNFGADRLEGGAKLSAIYRAAPAGLMRSTTH